MSGKPDWRRKQAALEAQKLSSIRTVGWVMAGPGALMLLAAALMWLDFGVTPRELNVCLSVIAVPLVISGVRRITHPEHYLVDGHGDLD
ncbi:MAG: hypothetical protein ACOZQL_23080 [Myxococcota bacterium]